MRFFSHQKHLFLYHWYPYCKYHLLLLKSSKFKGCKSLPWLGSLERDSPSRTKPTQKSPLRRSSQCRFSQTCIRVQYLIYIYHIMGCTCSTFIIYIYIMNRSKYVCISILKLKMLASLHVLNIQNISKTSVAYGLLLRFVLVSIFLSSSQDTGQQKSILSVASQVQPWPAAWQATCGRIQTFNYWMAIPRRKSSRVINRNPRALPPPTPRK